MISDTIEAKHVQDVEEENMCHLYEWYMLPQGRIHAQRFTNHPKLGDGIDIFTGTIHFIDREKGVAASKRTTYKLHEEAQ